MKFVLMAIPSNSQKLQYQRHFKFNFSFHSLSYDCNAFWYLNLERRVVLELRSATLSIAFKAFYVQHLELFLLCVKLNECLLDKGKQLKSLILDNQYETMLTTYIKSKRK